MKNVPWYKRTHIWCQVNLTENDPAECDPEFYKEYWKATGTEGVVINCGGIVTYYKSDFPYLYRAKTLGDTDYFGRWNQAARNAGLTVIARMDINATFKELYDVHQDWYCRDIQGHPILSQGRYVSCVNGGYYKELIPAVFREVIDKYHPDGFADNSWAGSGMKMICYCDNCKTLFMKETGNELPSSADWNDPIYRKWVRWNYNIRVENWKMFNRITEKYGGSDCKWMGMINADPFNTGGRFYDIKRLIRNAEYIFCDHQSRDQQCGFEQNALNGNLLRLTDEENVIVAESMAHYYKGERTFRLSAASRQEVRTWMMEGIAGQISPWCHFVGGVTRDSRRFHLSNDILPWIADNRKYLYERENMAQIGVLWNQESSIYYGRDLSDKKVGSCFRGITQMLSRAGLPFMPVHTDDLAKYKDRLSLLIIPNVAIMEEEQEQAVIDFVQAGGNLILTDETGLYDRDGEWKGPGRLYQYLNLKPKKEKTGSGYTGKEDWHTSDSHNYLKLINKEHEIFHFLEGGQVLAFGGEINEVDIPGTDWEKLAKFIPEFPIYPPEFAWVRDESDTGSIYCKEENDTRIVYLPADLDRCYGLFHNPDHKKILENIVKWTLNDKLMYWCEADGHVNINIYQTEKEIVVHLVNLAGEEVPVGALEKIIPLHQTKVKIKGKVNVQTAKGIYSGREYHIEKDADTFVITLPVLEEQEVLVLQ